ncbi:lysylphosphatidylglycerol synthase transmembrane domain-containing protein [Vagococcus humatus]|uniref:Phosphatidylglycerol lysyltransferase n=1 Tax=Vagococcus humatus TaxID=1889241 RepID=A0A3R9YXA7_9ENTE|nr:lysylphosphatidylglycerol synthase transmembrane domain-containing protein [Vagococcus humatus]RST89573.1 hypothetical protein C7P63_00380 [Vagococcus humatus]
MKKNPKTRLILNLIFLIIIFLLLFLSFKGSLTEIFQGVMETEKHLLALVLLLGSLYILAEGFNYRLLCRPFRESFTYLDGLFTFTYGAFYRVITFGTGTLVAEILYLNKRQLKTTQSMGIMTIHMVLYKLGILVFSVVGFIWQYDYLKSHVAYTIPFMIYGLLATCLVVFGLLFVSLNEVVHQKLVSYLKKWMKKLAWRERLALIASKLEAFRVTIHTLLAEPRLMIELVLYNIVRLLPWYSIPYVLLQQHPTIHYAQSIALISMISVLAGMLPSPAGIGSFEFVYLLLMTPLVGKIDAASSLLVYRFATYVFPALIGLLYTLYDKQKEIRSEMKEIQKKNQ